MRRLIPLYLFFLLLSAAVSAFGQSNYAVLGGTVFDPQQHAIPGATVELTSKSTQSARRVVSSEQGTFQFPGLLPGDYSLTVQATGFAPFTQTLSLEVGQQLTLDVNLK